MPPTAILDQSPTSTPATPTTPAPAATPVAVEPIKLPSGVTLSPAASALLGPELAAASGDATPPAKPDAAAVTADKAADDAKAAKLLRDEATGQFKSADPAAAAAGEPPKLSAEVIKRGEKLGYTRYELEQNFSDDAAATEWATFAEEELASGPGDTTTTDNADDDTPPPPKKPEPVVAPPVLEKEPPELDPNVEDAATIQRDKWFREQLRESRQQVTTLQKTLDERLGPLEENEKSRSEAAAKRENSRKSDLVDREVEKLGPEFVGVFGKGKRGEIGTAYMRARAQMFGLMAKLAPDFPRDTDEQLFTRAVRTAYGDVFDRLQTRLRHEAIRKQSGKRSGGGGDSVETAPPQPTADGPMHMDPVIREFLASRERR